MIHRRGWMAGIAAASFFFNGMAALAADSVGSASNQCLACHGNLKPLIRLTWEVEKHKKPQVSAETSGEG
jgi:hypothetical protein